jgi:hypothetical protein
MPVELRFGPDLSQTLKEASTALKSESDYYQALADDFFQEHPNARQIADPEITAGACYERMAQVLRKYAVSADGLFLNLERDLVRAMSPSYANLSDEAADKIIALQKEKPQI